MLRSIFYTDEKRNFIFEKYVQINKDVNTIMEDLTDAQYPGLDAPSNVKHLVDEIKESALDTIKDTIWVNTTLRTDFEGTVDLLKKIII